MEGIGGEFITTGVEEGQKLAQPVVIPTPEQQVEKPNPLIGRLAETKANAHAHSEKAIALIGTESAETPPPLQISPSKARAQLEELAENTSLTASEYLSKSKQVLTASSQIRNKTVEEQRALEQTTTKPYYAKRDIDEWIETLDQARGLRKIPAALEKRRLTGKSAALGAQLGQLNGQVQAKRQIVDQLSEREQPIRLRQQELLLEEIGKEIQEVWVAYEKLQQEIVQDGTTTTQIREAYIQQVISPQVEKIAEEKKLPPERKDEFYKALGNYLDHREEPEDQRQVFRQELDKLFDYNNGFYDVRNSCDALLRGDDKLIVQGFVVNMAAAEIAQIKTAVEPQLRNYDQRESFSRVFNKAIKPSDRWNRDENSFGTQVLSRFDQYRSGSGYENMELWGAMKSSAAANELFGDGIRQHDQEIYSAVLDKSLSDTNGGDIDMLYYYPTPDAIRNLVVIAAADSQEYRTVHANWTLNRLSKRPEWKLLLDAAEEKHPSLKATRQTLEKWNYTEYGNHPDIQKVAGDLAAALFEDADVDKRLTTLATLSLRNDVIVNILGKRNILNEQESQQIGQAIAFLRDTSEETWRQHRENDYKTPYLSDYAFTNGLRENLFYLLRPEGDTVDQQHLAVIKRFDQLSKVVLENKEDFTKLSYLMNSHVIDRLKNPSTAIDNIPAFLNASRTIPELSKENALMSEFCKQYKDADTVTFFRNITTAYGDLPKQLVPIVTLVGNSELSRERALELPLKASDILSGSLFSLSAEFPSLYLATDQDNDFFRKLTTSYQENADHMREASRAMKDKGLSHELALLFPQQASALMEDKMRESRIFIFDRAATMLKDTSDVRFLNSLVGEFGRKSDQLIRGYHECLTAGAISTNDKELVVEFARQFRVISPTTIQGYKEAKQAGHEKVYIAQLQALAERMTGSGTITDEERSKPYYKDLLRHVYSNNSGNWTSFESNESCPDRSADLSGFKIKPRYELDLLSQSEIRVKAGETLDPSTQERVQKPILDVAERMNALGHDKEKIQTNLQENVDNLLLEVRQKGGLTGIDLDSVTTLDEKLFLVLTDSIYGTRSINSAAVKDLVITYEFANFEDISDYIAGTQDRVGRANNQDYALLCEVGTFYSDRIKEVNRRLVQAAWNNPTIAATMPEYFQKLAQDTTVAQRKDSINRLQVERLGSSDSFVKQIGKMLEKRRGKKYTPDEVKNIIQRYESWTGGLTEKSSTSPKPETRAIYGQLRSQREKTLDAYKVITGTEIDPKDAHLGEIDLQQALATEANIREGKYDEEQFASYTVQRFIDLFEDERSKIDSELGKFESISGKQREVLYGYVTKTKESAHARMVGGACVCGDNPDKYPNQNIWSMPNYFQMVFQEPDTLQCQGLVLLHHFEEDGKKILTASFNPSSTYVYSIDESALFKGIAGSLQEFASDNGFDMVAVSHNKAIRTNRTGGEFEKAMDRRVSEVGKTHTFKTAQQFSYHPSYQLQEMDLVWERPTT